MPRKVERRENYLRDVGHLSTILRAVDLDPGDRRVEQVLLECTIALLLADQETRPGVIEGWRTRILETVG